MGKKNPLSQTFQQRWTLEEDLHFLQAMRLEGYGKWSNISKSMGGSRTPLQVKNRARHLLTYEVNSPVAKELRLMSTVSERGEKALKANYLEPIYIKREWSKTPKVHYEDDNEIIVSDPEDMEEVLVDDILEGDSSKHVVRQEILGLWNARKPLQLPLEEIFLLLSERNMEVVTELYYKLEEDNLINTETPRRRRIRDEQGNWIEEREGRTIHHTPSACDHDKRAHRKKPKVQDDFELFEPAESTEHVKIDSWISKVIQAHSLTSTNEVIGLLGGRLHSNTLHISNIYPCPTAAASGMECEMDALSELHAFKAFELVNETVVGWYHSHPTFLPHPSKRDLETQSMYQGVFEGGPFVGVICQPATQELVCFRVYSQGPVALALEHIDTDKDAQKETEAFERLLSIQHTEIPERNALRMFGLVPPSLHEKFRGGGVIDIL